MSDMRFDPETLRVFASKHDEAATERHWKAVLDLFGRTLPHG